MVLVGAPLRYVVMPRLRSVWEPGVGENASLTGGGEAQEFGELIMSGKSRGSRQRSPLSIAEKASRTSASGNGSHRGRRATSVRRHRVYDAHLVSQKLR